MSIVESLCMDEGDIVIAMCGFFRLQVQEMEKEMRKEMDKQTQKILAEKKREMYKKKKTLNEIVNEVQREIPNIDIFKNKAFLKKYEKIRNKIHTNFIQWLLQYCNNERLAQKILKSFFPLKYQNEEIFNQSVNITPLFEHGSYKIILSGKWKQQQNDKTVSIDNFLSVIEEYAEQLSENLSM